MAESTTTRPSRTRRGAKADTTAPAKATPAKATKATAPKAAPAALGTDDRVKTPIIMEFSGETKSYAVFVPPAGSGCVGKFYAPPGTEEIKVLLIGSASE